MPKTINILPDFSKLPKLAFSTISGKFSDISNYNFFFRLSKIHVANLGIYSENEKMRNNRHFLTNIFKVITKKRKNQCCRFAENFSD